MDYYSQFKNRDGRQEGPEDRHWRLKTGVVNQEMFLRDEKPTCCEFCRLIYDGVERCVPGWMHSNREHKRITVDEVSPGLETKDSQIAAKLLNIALQDGEQIMRLELADFSNVPYREELEALETILSLFAKRRTSAAISWLTQCAHRHKICQTPDPDFVPRRLVDVGSEDIEPHLVDTESHGLSVSALDHSQYAALSYCWGPQKGTFTTVRTNVEQNKRSIKLLALPYTIQDAIRVCRTLKIQYLWVDALCIIQDDIDERDWYEQSGKMKHIYSNSYLTIAADDSSKCVDGFWDIRAEGWTKITSAPSKIFWPRILPSWIRKVANDNLFGLDALSTRGWALQESVLPNRILHFTAHGIRWECNHWCQSEQGLASYNWLMLTFRTLRIIKLGQLGKKSLPHGFGVCHIDEDEIYSSHITDFLTACAPKSVYFAWNSVMENYSAKQLTKQADKLTAISGLASLMVEYLGLPLNSYLAGLWLDDLASGLLWYVKGPKTPCRAKHYIAPTWSWASIDGCIKYFKERYQFIFRSVITILEAKCISSPLDPTGRVTAGNITLTGLVVPVAVKTAPIIAGQFGWKSNYTGGPGCASRTHMNKIVWVQSLLYPNAVPYEVLCDDEADPILPTNEILVVCKTLECLRHNVCACSPSLNAYCCLRVGVTEDSCTGGKRYWWLLLERSTTADETYRRIGLGYFQILLRSFDLFKLAKSHTITII